MTDTTAKGDIPGNLSPNVAAALSYLFGFVSGILFFMLSKDKFVRFHALQSTIVSLSFLVLSFVMPFLAPLISIALLVLMIVLIVKAYQGEKFKLPIAGDIAQKNA